MNRLVHCREGWTQAYFSELLSLNQTLCSFVFPSLLFFFFSLTPPLVPFISFFTLVASLTPRLTASSTVHFYFSVSQGLSAHCLLLLLLL